MIYLIILLLAAGLALIVLEAFVPGGVLGVIGVAAIIASAVLCFMEYGAATGSFYLIGSLLVGLIVGVSAFLLVLRRFTLKAPQVELDEGKHSLRGRRGEVVKVLDPTGTIEIEGHKHPARAESSLQSIDKGEQVEVIGHDSIYLLVARVEEDSEQQGED